MTDKEKLLKILQEIGVDAWETDSKGMTYDAIIAKNENLDVDENSFWFKFDKVTGKYVE